MLQLFHPLARRHILAARFAGEEARTGSTEPIKITELPSLGGANTLRGYLSDRYIGNAAALATLEYRYRLSRIVEATAFADFGKVMPRLLDFDFTDIHRSWGAGFRFASADWMYLRLQVAAMAPVADDL